MILYILLHAALHDTRASLDAANIEDHAQLRVRTRFIASRTPETSLPDLTYF